MKFVVFVLILIVLGNIFLGDERLLIGFDSLGNESRTLFWVLSAALSIGLSYLLMMVMFIHFKDYEIPGEDDESEEEEYLPGLSDDDELHFEDE